MSGAALRGLGALLPGAAGSDAFRAAFGAEPLPPPPELRVGEFDLSGIFPEAGRFRRAAPATRFALAAAAMAAADGAIPLSALAGDRSGVVVAVTHGAVGYAARCHEGIVRDGMGGASPLYFTESVLNAAAGNVSIALGIRGAVHTLVGEETAGIRAAALASSLIASGRLDRCLVVGTEEREPVVDLAWESFDRLGGPDRSRPPGEGSVALLLVRADSEEGKGRPRLFTAFGAGGPLFGGEAEDGLEEAAASALARAAVGEGRVGLVALPAGRGRGRAARWVGERFGSRPLRVDPGERFGNLRAASSLLQVAASACLVATAGAAGLSVAAGYDGTAAAAALLPGEGGTR